jgi:hypothetical protein
MVTGSVVMLGSLLMTSVVPGRPFEAEYERRVSRAGSGEEVERGTIAVDGQGRARTAVEMPGGQAIAAVWDPIKKTAWIVDSSSNRLLMDVPWPEKGSGAATTPIVTAATTVAPSASQSLGTNSIEGLECDGTRTIIEAPGGRQTVERWISRDLGHVVLEVRSNDSERVTFRMLSIRRGEPASELFQHAQ